MDPAIDPNAASDVARARDDRVALELLDRLPVAIVLTRPADGNIVYVNLSVVAIAHAEGPHDLIGRPIHTFVEPEDIERLETASRRVVSGGIPGPDRIYRMRRCDDTHAVMEVHSIPFPVGDETLLLSVLTDATQQPDALRALAFVEERYRSLIQIAPIGIAVHADGRYTFANKEFARLLDAASPKEIIGLPVTATLPPEDRESAVAEMRRATAGGAARARMTLDMVGLTGRRFRAEVIGRRVEYEGSVVTELFVRELPEMGPTTAPGPDSPAAADG